MNYDTLLQEQYEILDIGPKHLYYIHVRCPAIPLKGMQLRKIQVNLKS